MKDFYYILGTSRTCTPTELNAAYRKLAQKLQPGDAGNDQFLDNHFQEITEAYQLLSNPAKRRKYDIALKKSQQKRFYWFRLSHVDIAAAFAFVAFTALFGFYVLSVLKGDKAKKAKIQAATVVQPVVKHHRKKKAIKLTPVYAAAKQHVVIPDTTKIPIITIASNKPLPVKPAPVKLAPVKSVPIKAYQPPVEQKLIVANNATYTTELKANVTGLVYLHQMADYRSAVLASIPNHGKVLVLEKGAGFYKVTFGDQTGYVPKWTVGNP